MRKLFVYGTLRAGDSRNHVLSDSGCKKLPGLFKSQAKMFSVGGFPAIIPDKHSFVVGEVWEVPEDLEDRLMRRLDAIEGVSSGLYNKVELDVSDEAGVYKATAYVAGPLILKRIEEGELPVIPNGDWLAYGRR